MSLAASGQQLQVTEWFAAAAGHNTLLNEHPVQLSVLYVASDTHSNHIITHSTALRVSVLH